MLWGKHEEGMTSYQEWCGIGSVFRKDFLEKQYLGYTLKGELVSDRGPPSRKPNAQKT